MVHMWVCQCVCMSICICVNKYVYVQADTHADTPVQHTHLRQTSLLHGPRKLTIDLVCHSKYHHLSFLWGLSFLCVGRLSTSRIRRSHSNVYWNKFFFCVQDPDKQLGDSRASSLQVVLRLVLSGDIPKARLPKP